MLDEAINGYAQTGLLGINVALLIAVIRFLWTRYEQKDTAHIASLEARIEENKLALAATTALKMAVTELTAAVAGRSAVIEKIADSQSLQARGLEVQTAAFARLADQVNNTEETQSRRHEELLREFNRLTSQQGGARR